MINKVVFEKMRIERKINNWHQLGSKWPVKVDLSGMDSYGVEIT